MYHHVTHVGDLTAGHGLLVVVEVETVFVSLYLESATSAMAILGNEAYMMPALSFLRLLRLGRFPVMIIVAGAYADRSWGICEFRDAMAAGIGDSACSGGIVC